MWEIGVALSALTIGVAVLRDRCLTGVALVLLTNWIANTAAVRISGDPNFWGFFLFADYLSGVLAAAGIGLLCQRFTVGGVVIGLSYALECVVHAAYGLSDHGTWAQRQYYWTTFYIAVGQMMFVGGWGIYELARRYDRARRGLSPDRPVRARRGARSGSEG